MNWFYKGIEISQWVNYFISNKHLNETVDYVEEYYYDSWYKNSELATAPLSVSLSITDLCSLRCKHCSKSAYFDQIGNLATENYKAIIDKLALEKVRKLVLTGGEPLLHDHILEFIEYAKAKRMYISILTNMNIESDTLEKILALLEEKDSIQVSIDGVYERYSEIRHGGDFMLLSDNCDILNSTTVSTTANMVVTAENVYEMVDVLNFCERKKFRNIRFTPLFACSEIMNPPSDIKAFTHFIEVLKTHQSQHYRINIQANPVPLLYPYFSYLKKEYCNFPYETSYYRCPAAVLSFEIDIRGDAYPCTYLINRAAPFGNIYKNSLQEIWNSAQMNYFRNSVSKAKQCQKCDQLKNCMGGCKAESFMAYGTYDLGDDTCFVRREDNEV